MMSGGVDGSGWVLRYGWRSGWKWMGAEVWMEEWMSVRVNRFTLHKLPHSYTPSTHPLIHSQYLIIL